MSHFQGNGTRASSLRGSFWLVLGFGGQKAIQLVSSLVLTRILFPEAFGLMAIANVVVLALAMFSDLGIRSSVVKSTRGDSPEFVNTAWTLKIIRGAVLWLITCILAAPMAIFYGENILFPLICFLGFSAVIEGFGSISEFLEMRKLRLARVIAVQFLSTFAGTAITIAFAYVYDTVWALAVGSIAASLIKTVLGYLVLPYHAHHFTIQKDSAREIIHFGRWILLATMVNFFSGHGLPLVQGALVTIEVLGLITIARTLVMVFEELIQRIITNVGFSALSRIVREDREKLPAIVYRLRWASNLAIIPVFLALSVFGPYLVKLLYDERYTLAGTFLSILAVNSALRFLELLYQNTLLVLGDSRSHFYISLSMAVLRYGCMLAGYWATETVSGMLYGLCLGSALAFLISLAYAIVNRYANVLADIAGLLMIGIYLAVTIA
ncbi:oligosaccharide flippase family protein [Microbulbifer sp. YPW1]|uniref:oligosaccharide flippase family protein n=1 Tax=Microbulbifer sp. YPW1 TaxID=2745199 RepID=UPI0021076743|nr:oligosaccharide flippase family protein [Microbulbifer sp. YPW1]